MAYDNSKDIAAVWVNHDGGNRPAFKIKVNADNLAKALREGGELALVGWRRRDDANPSAPDFKISLDVPREGQGRAETPADTPAEPRRIPTGSTAERVQQMFGKPPAMPKREPTLDGFEDDIPF